MDFTTDRKSRSSTIFRCEDVISFNFAKDPIVWDILLLADELKLLAVSESDSDAPPRAWPILACSCSSKYDSICSLHNAAYAIALAS